MHPDKVDRHRVTLLTDLPNIGAAGARDLQHLGIDVPAQLLGTDPFELYDRLCAVTATRHDPCVIDVMISVTRFMAGEAPRPWWAYTVERKEALAQRALESRHG